MNPQFLPLKHSLSSTSPSRKSTNSQILSDPSAESAETHWYYRQYSTRHPPWSSKLSTIKQLQLTCRVYSHENHYDSGEYTRDPMNARVHRRSAVSITKARSRI